MFLEICLTSTILILLWIFSKSWYGKFDNTGIPQKKCIPILGNFWKSLIRREAMVLDLDDYYNNVGDERSRFIGAYSILFPGLMIKDPQIIKQVTVKDFDFFVDHRNGFQEDLEPLFGKSLIAVTGQKWRDMRAALSPVFTSSKIRDMCPFVSQVGIQMTEYLKCLCDENLKINGQASAELEMKNLSTRFMTDVIASSIFGIEVNSFKHSNNEFYLMGNTLISIFNTKMFFKVAIVMLFPSLGKALNLHLFDEKVNHFFRELVLSAMKYREENNIVRRDMIQILMDLKKGNLKREKHVDTAHDTGFATVQESDIGKRDIKTVWEDDDLVAQTMLFFLGGFETSSTTASFVLHEIGINPEVQEKLRVEVDDHVKKHGLDVTYDMIQNLKYMDMVVSEGLRKWPPNVLNDRLCVKSIDIGPVMEDERTSYTVKKDDIVWIPVYSLHRDEKYWPNPSKFDPERFSDENKHKIIPFTYLPFGSGPRNCIGSRFALMEIKIFLYHIIANFKIEACSRTQEPIVLDKTTFVMRPENGFWLNFVKRDVSKI